MSPVHHLSQLAHRCLSPQRFEALRRVYLSARARTAPLALRWHGTFSAEMLVEHLRPRLKASDLLMVHCSINHMQPMFRQGAPELLAALTSLTPSGITVVMPTFNFGDPADGGAYATLKRKQRIELRRLPSQMGLLSELFRRTRGVVSSRHPVMRLSALGPEAAGLVAGHETAALPCGEGSPFAYLERRNALIVGLGRTIEVLTHVHHVEDVMGDQFPVPSQIGEPLPLTLVDGTEEIPFQLRSRSLSGTRDMLRLRRLMPRAQLHEWRFHGVPMFAVRAQDVTSALARAARAGQSLYRP